MIGLLAGMAAGQPSQSAGRRDVVIAGGGPAGLAAALYSARYRLSTVVLEGYQPGGQAALTDRIDNYPGVPGARGPELAALMRTQAREAGAEIVPARAQRSFFSGDGFTTETDSGVFESPVLVVATGAAPRKLGVPGEERLYGRGVSYCATCDAPFFKNRRVLVVGGGDSAVKEALHLAGYASSVTLVHRRDALRAEPVLARKLLDNPVCDVVWSSRLLEIRGGDEVESVLLDTPGGQRELGMDGVFIYVGRRAETDPFRDLLELREDGTVVTEGIVRTSRRGVFAAGDVTGHEPRQIVTAVADGARAAAAAYEYLQHRPAV